MRLHCFNCGKIVSTEVPDGTIFRAVAQCPECAAKVQSQPEPPASTSGTAAPGEAGLAPGANDLPACDTSSNTPSGLTTAPYTGACKSDDEFPASEAFARTAYIALRNDAEWLAASSATPRTGGSAHTSNASPQ